jgi:glycosyltransferase involved in cell wall biosynthesis
MSQFSIVIPTWNNLAYLKLCIESIRKNSEFNNQIIVFVNDGSDGTREWIKAQKDIAFDSADKNVGICIAVNSCRAFVRSKYIVYLNDDMYVCPGWDKALFDAITEIGHDEFMLSSTLIEPHPVANPNYVSIVKNLGDSISSFREKELLEQYNTLGTTDWSGSSWPPSVVSTRMWDIVGGYSIEFSPGMYSDPDFSMKLWKYGVRIFRGVAKSKVYHFQSKSTGKVKKNDGNKTFLIKWGISAKVFYRYYLHMGKPATGLDTNVAVPFSARLGNTLKRMIKTINDKSV